MDLTDELWPGVVADELAALPVKATQQRFRGRVWDVRTDEVEFPDGLAARDYVVHTGAVAIAALNAADQLYLIRQYRHPAASYLFELPAGLLDVPGEDPLYTAERELAEEAGLVAGSWNVLTDFFTSPGGSTEAIRLYLARDVSERPGGRIQTGEAEEVSLPGVWVSVDDAVQLVLAGSIGNAIAVIGILAVAAAQRDGWTSLREARAQWPQRDFLNELGRVRSGRNE